MKCPVCQTAELAMSSRQSIEIDYCPQCRGVWLDRGELDKLIERSVEETSPQRARQDAPPQQPYRDDDRSRGYHGKHHGKKSFWHEIFD